MATTIPLTPAIGAEVTGIDLGTPITPEVFKTIHHALLDQLVAHPNDPGLEGHPEVMIIHADETSKRVAGESWHSDVSCEVEPPMGSILRIHTLPETGGDTVFASMYAAYDALSTPMKRMLDGLTAILDG